MAFLNIEGQHINTDHITHVAEKGDDVEVTFANGTVCGYTGANAAAILKAVGAGKAKVEHKADDDAPHARGHSHATKAH